MTRWGLLLVGVVLSGWGGVHAAGPRETGSLSGLRNQPHASVHTDRWDDPWRSEPSRDPVQLYVAGEYTTFWGHSGQGLGLNFGGGVAMANVGRMGVRIGIESGRTTQRAEDYYGGVMFSSLFEVEHDLPLSRTLLLGLGLRTGHGLTPAKFDPWFLQPTLTLTTQTPLRGWSIPPFSTRTIALSFGARFMPYGVDAVVGVGVQ